MTILILKYGFILIFILTVVIHFFILRELRIAEAEWFSARTKRYHTLKKYNTICTRITFLLGLILYY